MNNDLISREALKKSIEELKKSPWYCEHKDTIDGIASRQAQKEALQIVENTIDNAPTVKTYCYFCGQTEHGRVEERPQGEFVKKLNERIAKSVCKYCQMNKKCELCVISRVFQIITLTAEEQKGGAK